MGCSLYKSSATSLVGTLYQNSGLKKETGFTLLYVFVNIGAVLGPLVYGLVVYKVGWSFGFLCSALGILLATFLLLRNSSLLVDSKKIEAIKKSTTIVTYIRAC